MRKRSSLQCGRGRASGAIRHQVQMPSEVAKRLNGGDNVKMSQNLKSLHIGSRIEQWGGIGDGEAIRADVCGARGVHRGLGDRDARSAARTVRDRREPRVRIWSAGIVGGGTVAVLVVLGASVGGSIGVEAFGTGLPVGSVTSIAAHDGQVVVRFTVDGGIDFPADVSDHGGSQRLSEQRHRRRGGSASGELMPSSVIH
ncbi:hypothetical protein ACWDPV_12185 [Gordonia sp. NPDC003504]